MIPEGYEKLAVIGISYKGDYVDGTAYGMLNAVFHEGSTYVALKDNPAGPPAADGANWQYLAKGFVEALLSTVRATDTSGLIGTAGAEVGAQDLMDVIADRVATKLLARSNVVNNLLTTEEGFALDARQGKALKDELDITNRDFDVLESGIVNTFRMGAAVQSQSAPTLYRIGKLVYGSGLITTTNSSSWTEKTHVFTVPSDWVPAITKITSIMTMNGMARFDVAPDGCVFWYPEESMVTNMPANSWINLDDFSYTIR